MSLARAIETGDLAELPSRRDEDWHWTDLRGLIRAIPAASPAFEGDLPTGRFDADGEVRIVNGRGPRRIVTAPGEAQTIALRFIAATPGTAHSSKISLLIGAEARVTLFETYEALADG